MPNKNPFTTFKDNYVGAETEKDNGIVTALAMERHYKSLQNDLIIEMQTGKKDVSYGTYAKQTQILKQISQRIDEFNGTAGTELFEALKEAAAYQTKLAIDDMTIMGMGIRKPEEWHADYNDDYVKKTFIDTYEHIAGQTNKMLLTTKEGLRRDSAKIFKRAAVEGWSRKKACKELRDEMLRTDPSFKFTDKTGRQWNTSSYFDMLTRTVMKTVQNESYANTLINEGHDLVKVNHNGAKDECRLWEGKVLSLTGATPGYMTVDQAQSTGEVFHPRCKHRVLAYNPEIDAVFDMMDAGVSAGKIIGSSKKAVQEAINAIPEEVGETEKVASRFKDPEHQAKYLEYVKQGHHALWKIEGMMKHHTGKTLKDVGKLYDPRYSNFDSENIWQKHFRKPMRSWMEKNCPTLYNALDSWQGSTHGALPMTLKVLHAKLEGDLKDVKWRDDSDVALKQSEVEKRSSERDVIDEYIRMRALNQAYMEKIGLAEIELTRGTGGRGGAKYAAQLRDNPDTDFFHLREANLAGYTTSQKISNDFGVDAGGITCTKTFRQGDIVVHKDMFGGVTGGYLKEYEFIVKSGSHHVPIGQVAYDKKTRISPQSPASSQDTPQVKPAKIKTVNVEGGSGWLENYLAGEKPLPTKDEVDDLYSMGMINGADKAAYLQIMK